MSEYEGWWMRVEVVGSVDGRGRAGVCVEHLRVWGGDDQGVGGGGDRASERSKIGGSWRGVSEGVNE